MRALLVFWLLLSVASVCWYLVLIFYVGYRGATDIRRMLKDLRDEKDLSFQKSTPEHLRD